MTCIDLKQTSEDVRVTIEQLRSPCQGSLMFAAHRGLRWSGIPENSSKSLIAAAKAGIKCVEIDIRLTSDGHVVCLHDKGLGRVTDIAEQSHRNDVYSPFTGTGYNPRVDSLPWTDVVSRLRLKDETGRKTDQSVLDLETLLETIHEHELRLVVLFDVKEKRAMQPTFDMLKTWKNSDGVPAVEWCVWKTSCKFFRHPENLEEEAWVQEAMTLGSFNYIPVYDSKACRTFDALKSLQAFDSRPYVISFEIGLRGPGGHMQELVSAARKTGKGLGFFAALGDLWPLDGRQIHYQLGPFHPYPWSQESALEWSVEEGQPPQRYEDLLRLNDPSMTHDHRGDIALYRSMGFTWAIADYIPLLLTGKCLRCKDRCVHQ